MDSEINKMRQQKITTVMLGRIQNGLALCEVTGPAPAPAFAFEMTLSILQAAINLAAAVALGLGWRMDIVK